MNQKLGRTAMYYILTAKGQLISEANYLELDSSEKRTKYSPNYALATRIEVLGSCFGRIEDK